MLLSGERQVAPSVDGIRRDHVARYEWAAGHLAPCSRVLDVACGVGYGAHLLARRGHRVVAIDRDREAIAYARQHYRHPRVTYRVADAEHLPTLRGFDAAISFETIEHLRDPSALLRALRRAAPRLFLSVPNEEVFAFRGQTFHQRHYTAAEFAGLLRETRIEPVEWCGQSGPYSDVEPAMKGRTLVVRAGRGKGIGAPIPFAPGRVPEHVVILGLGPSLESYVDLIKRLGSRKAFSDEVWGINAVGDVIKCDRIFHMDDVRVQEARAVAAPESNIARMLDWMKGHPGPIYTSQIPEKNAYPGLVEFPLEDVINALGFAYFNSTAAFAVAYAIFIGVKKISLYGFDFTYPDAHKAEKGRACVEFWCGYAAAKGIELGRSDRTSLFDTIEDPKDENELRPYGYDAVTVKVAHTEQGAARLAFEPKPLPTAAEIEHRYDHGRHPNPLTEKHRSKS